MRMGKSLQSRRLRRQLAQASAARRAAEMTLEALGALRHEPGDASRRPGIAAAAGESFLLQALMNTIPDYVYFKDRDSRIIMISRAQARLFRLDDPADAIGKTDFDFFSQEHARQARADELRIIESGQPLTLEERETWPDLPDTWVSTTKVALRDARGEIVGTFGISRDITERRRIEAAMQAQLLELQAVNRKLTDAQNQLLQADKMASVGQLAAGVAHEINNPIGFIRSNLNSLKGQVADLLDVIEAYRQAEPALAGKDAVLAAIRTARERADLDFLQKDIVCLIDESIDGANRVKRIVDNLKDFSRVDTDEWHYANLEKGLDSTLNIVWNEVKYKAEVKCDYAGLPEIECVASQINQVFLNLLVNAAQAIEERGVITLTTGYDDAFVWVEVADTGCGISPENQGKIFEPFFTTKPIGKGTGLGLSLAYGIVKRHQGRLEVRSEPGKGSAFRLLLPRRREAGLPVA